MTLTAADLELHRQLGIGIDLLIRQQVRRVTDRDARDLLNVSGKRGDLSGIEYPYLDPHTGRRVTSRIRRDRPELEQGRPKAKYCSPFGDRKHLYFVTTDAPMLADTHVPVIVVEAEKSALAIASLAQRQDRPIVPIATGGCWGWRGRIGKADGPKGERLDELGILPDFDRIVWPSRLVYLAFDANAASNPKVQAARGGLSRELLTRKARVHIVTLPEDNSINGPDDFIGAKGDAAFLKLLENAITADVGVTLDDFRAYMPAHSYIFMPARELWPAASVNARIRDWPTRTTETGESKLTAPSAWLDRHRAVEQMTWCPGLPEVIADRLIADGGWIERVGCSTVNLYRPSRMARGNFNDVGLWLNHIMRIYPDDTDHLIGWFAHRVQRPFEKINHAIVLGGAQGIGKDSLLEPLKHAVGPWNFAEILPEQLLARFNGFVRSVVLRINEAKDQGEIDRYALYERLKIYCAAPPDVIRCDEKHLREHYVMNVTGVVITTNYKTDGIYLPADDRRHYVAWCDLTKDDFGDAYWKTLWNWYADGGLKNVVAFLDEYDLSSFDPKAPPKKTEAWWAIVDANRPPEDAELADVLEELGYPDVVTLGRLADRADSSFAEFMRDRKNARRISHRMEEAGYLPVRNEAAKDGLWRVDGKRQAIYGKRAMDVRDRVTAARRLVGW
jgi:hypothetical protein